MKMLASLLLLLSLSLVIGVAPGQKEEECEETQPPFDDIFELAQQYCTSNFPPDQFKVSCLLASCPSLSSLCPLTCDGSVNQTALTLAVTILNQCIGKNELICNFNMSHTSMAPISWTTVRLIPPSMVNGTVVHIPGTGYIDNFSKATFTIVQQQNENPITLVIRAPTFFGYGSYNCTFNFPSNSILRSLRGILPALTLPDTSLNTPNMRGDLHVNVTSTVSFDLTTHTAKTIDQQFDFNIFFSNFVNCNGKKLEQGFVDAFNTGMNMFGKRSVIPAAIIDFLSTYAALGLQAAQLNCP